MGNFSYLIQKNRLKFKVIESEIDHDHLREIIKYLSKQNEWIITKDHEDIIVTKTKGGFLTGSWGEQVTIVLDKQKILVNSICDPDKRASVTSFGQNRKNVTIIETAIKKANNQASKTKDINH
ncbi:hypothetical protein DMA11_11135 [Marinilabiliaceae bacterium JC017]|nr:hypothetical protein DMA11_11135 [Marinilabiliaceae bacterium JC017]